MNEFTFEELPPGRYSGVIEKVRFNFGTATTIVITYKLETPNGIRRVEDRMPIDAPKSSVGYFNTTKGLGRVEAILKLRGMTLADADGLGSLPKLIEGVELGVVTRNTPCAGYRVPVVVRLEAA